jgi:hypothetical protein
MNKIVFADSDVPSIYFPVGAPNKGGSCAFTTPQCLEYCPSGQVVNEHEVTAFNLFREESVEDLIGCIHNEFTELTKDKRYEKILQWHAWGDCLPELTRKTALVITGLNHMGVTQYGFTRNRALWELLPMKDNLRIGLTVDDTKIATTLSKNAIVCSPHVKTGYAQEFVYGKIRAKCSGWWTVLDSGETRNSHCTVCFKNGEGCFYREL